MDVSHLLAELNDAQREAVAGSPGNYLVLAGAGSGKTRVLVHRLAWLIQVVGLSPSQLLAVTFTNKAANEMRERTQQLIAGDLRGLWIGTFHGLAHRLLRRHHQAAGLPEDFRILDADDQLRLIKRVMEEQQLDRDKWPPRRAMGFINDCKDEGIRPDALEPDADPVAQIWGQIYAAYDARCRDSGLVDFGELLLRSHELWLENDDLLAHYQSRFANLLVDEFQDTNAVQYAWLKVLAGERSNLFVVGDDDQSIYGWRGARVEHVLRFNEDFPDATVVRLEQNYRSSGNILNAANALIARNDGRLGKNLWTADGDGELIQLYNAFNETDEARFVVDVIEQWLEEGRDASEAAILYRSNAQSRVFEERLITRRIPYRVYGGLRFFERAEIKDVLAYLRLASAPDDDAAFERIVNVPARGIGEKTVATVRSRARTEGISLWAATRHMLAANQAGRAARSLALFVDLINQIAERSASVGLDELVTFTREATELQSHYDKEGPERAEARRENLDELVAAAGNWEVDEADEANGLTPLNAFLAHAALEAGEGQAQSWEDCVQLMSMHSAKGLEFPLVFVCGLEQGLFPHSRSRETQVGLEEERRLAYVAITRARERLYLTCAESRRWRGSEAFNPPSQFIDEIPRDLIHDIRPRRSSFGRAVPSTAAPVGGTIESAWRLGDQVQHERYGEGVIIDFSGQGEHLQAHVNFAEHGPKIIIVAYANMSRIG